MVSCTEFIPLYSELFWYLDGKAGHDGVARYWDHIADVNTNETLGALAREKGIAGCFEYWRKVTVEEACDVYREYDDEAQTMYSHMRHCPSRGRLNEMTHMTPYYDYCGHCNVLYKRVLGPLGIIYENTNDNIRPECEIRIWAEANGKPELPTKG